MIASADRIVLSATVRRLLCPLESLSMLSNFSRMTLVLTLFAVEAVPASAQTVSIGIPPSLVQDMSVGQLKFFNNEFPAMVKEFTGIDAKLVTRDSIDAVGKRLVDGADQFAVLQGVEYGWLKAKHPEIQPVLVGIYHLTQPRAVLLTKKDAAATSFADLKGKSVAILKAGKEYIQLFAAKGAGGDPKQFFGKIVETSNAETALDDILLGKVAAAIVDQASLDNYKDVNPGRFARLNASVQSEPFPPMGLFCVPSKVSADIVEKLRTGMLKANKSSRSRDAMATFKITSFEQVPAEYATWVADIVKAYPEPKAK
jgi:ABC-type phosphate/phosphonate transport system substrate-binding protein